MIFEVNQENGKIIVTNRSDKTVTVREIRLTIETTVITPEEKLSIRKITDEMKIVSRLKPNDRIEIKTYYTNVVSVSVVYELEGVVEREDHEL